MITFAPPCEPNEYDTTYEPVLAVAESPALGRLVVPRIPRGLRLIWSGPYEDVAMYARSLWEDTAAGVLPITLDGTRPVVGNFLMDRLPATSQAKGVWSISMTLYEDLL